MWTQWVFAAVCVGLGLVLQTALHDQHPHPGQTMCDARKLGLVVIGDDGSLGRMVLHALDTISVAQADFCGASVHIAAVGGSRGYLKHSHGLSWDHLRSLLNHTTVFHGANPPNESPSPVDVDSSTNEQVDEPDTDDDGVQQRDTLRDVLGDLAAFGHYDKFIVVDCTTTAAPGHVDDLIWAKSLGMGLVIANIQAVAGPWASYQSLVLNTAKAKQSSLVAVDATVGRGLPVLSTLARLQASGDHITLVRGTFSDAVGHVLAEMEAGSTFGDAVTTVYENGLTEDDPRDDLTVRSTCNVILMAMAGRSLGAKGCRDCADAGQAYGRQGRRGRWAASSQVHERHSCFILPRRWQPQ
ncbi:hypothetical protein, variant [Aphanomyces invadans]|uniref:homoserine dehydrogenase n=1 Tax=Aphanomyces invadans TaxID=157072 RepID=A0A024U8E2_9STRA|nr:hypothetical protein, variant [Aphanomyces invadans]ETW01853.1 hypothetical protein, variant [Aphanomyces invadans]|eukprot:XP_008869701.1 hypothetical protein, variant [Aphanomyces invadans]